MSSTSGIQGELLEVTVVGCFNLKKTKKPFVCLRYGNTEFCTRTCTDGGKNPVFQDKFVFTLIDGCKELYLVLKSHHRFIADNLIGSGIVHLGNVLSQGFDDRRWPLQTNKRRAAAGEVQVLLRYPNSPRPTTEFHCVPSPMHHHHVPSAPPFAPAATYAPHYPPYPPPSPAAYPPQPYPPTSAYTPPPPPWCPPPRTAAYPPQPDPRTSTYPPPPAPSYNHSGRSHPRMYPAPPC